MGVGLVLLFLVPMAVMASYSLFQNDANFQIVPNPTLRNYANFFDNEVYVATFLKTVVIATLTTILCLVAALPFAYGLVRYVSRRWQRVVLVAVILPFWSSYLLRVYSWQAILGEHGLVNQALQRLGLIDQPVTFFAYTNSGVVLVLIYVYVPFAILAIYSSLERFDFNLLASAQDLGARPDQAIRYILLPRIRSGIITACVFVFIPVLGEYLTPQLVGGVEGTLIANLIVNFFRALQYPTGAAAAFLIAGFVTVLLIVLRGYLRFEDVAIRV